MLLHFVDIELPVACALRRAFAAHSEVLVTNGDILAIAKNTIVSPANGYGIMDGGIDGAYTEYFGLRPQTELQTAIARRPNGILPVGASIVVRTGDNRIPYMICAPTMETPGPIPAQNCFYAMAAVLNAASRHVDLIEEVYCPGLGTNTGRVSAELAANEMEAAYRKWKDTSRSRR